MDILRNLSSDFKIYAFQGPSTLESISKLVLFSAIPVPQEFLDIIKTKTEIEICVGNKKFIRIWGADGCIEMNQAYEIQKYIPNSLAIGDDEDGNAIIYVVMDEKVSVYSIAFNDLEIDEMIYISKTLEDFLVRKDGLDTILKM